MADYDAGRVFLQVVPSFRGVHQLIGGEANRWGREAGRAFQDGFDREVGRSRTNVGPSASDSRRQGSEAGGAFGDAFRRRVEAAMRSLPPVKIGPVQAGTVEAKIREIRLALERLSDKTIGVDVDSASALAELRRLDSELRDLDGESADIQVRVDAAAARAQLAAVEAQVRDLDGETVNITVRADTSSALAGLNTFTGRLGALATAGLALGPAIIPVAAAASAALAGIGLGATAGLAGVGALAVGFHGLGDALKLLDKAEETSARNAVRSAGMRQQAAEGVANAQRALESAERGLAQARANAANQAETAARRVIDAQEGVTEAVEQGNRAVEDAARRVADAQREVGEATEEAAREVEAALRRQASAEERLALTQRRTQRAQEDLTRARRDAREALEDLELSVRGAALSEERAAINLEEARARHAMALSEGWEGIDLRDVELSLREAELAYDEAVERNQDIKAEAEEARAAGVEGSEAVRDAIEREADARREEAEAVQGVRDAEEEVVRARERGAQRVARAQENLTRALEAQSRTQVDAARRVEEAHQRVAEALIAQQRQQEASAFALAGAIASVEGAQASLASAIAASSAAAASLANEAQREFGELSPAMQEFARYIDSTFLGQDGLWTKFRNEMQAAFLPDVQRAIEMLVPFQDEIIRFGVSISEVMGDLAVSLAEALISDDMRAFFSYLAQTAPGVLRELGEAAIDVMVGLANLFVAMGPLAERFIVWIGDMAEKFREWSEGADEEGSGFQKFLDYVERVAPKVVDIVGDLIEVMVDLGIALAPLGEDLLDIINGITNFMEVLGPENLSKIWTLGLALRAAHGGFGLLNTVLGGGGGLGGGGLAATLGRFIGPAGLLAAFVGGLTLLYFHNDEFRKLVDSAWDDIAWAIEGAWDNVIEPVFGDMLGWLDERQDYSLIDGFKDLKKAADDTWDGIQRKTKERWGEIKADFGEMKNWLTTELPNAFNWLKEQGSSKFESLRGAVETGWTNIRDRAFNPMRDHAENLVVGAFERGRSGVTGAWGLMKGTLQDIWDGTDGVRQTVFAPMMEGAEHAVGGAFERGREVIGGAWDLLPERIKEPIRDIVDTVINQGIIDGFNWIAEKVNVGTLDHFRPKALGFASGGIYPGYTPGRDIGYIGVSGGEAIMRPEWTRAIGAEAVHEMNRVARMRGVQGVRQYLGGHASGGVIPFLGNYQLGDVVRGAGNLLGRLPKGPSGLDLGREGIKQGEQALGAITGAAKDFIVGQFKRAAQALVDPLVNAIPEQPFLFGLMRGAARKLADGLFGMGEKEDSKALSLGGGAFSVGGGNFGPILNGRNAANTVAAMNFVESTWGHLVGVIGGYRPEGSVSTSDHPKGKALDIMIDNWTKAAGIAAGNLIAAWFTANPSMFGTKYVIWRDMINSGSGWRPYRHPSDPSGRDANLAHRNHVHVSLFDSGGRLAPGVTMAMNASNHPELILNRDQEGAIAAALRERSKGGQVGGFINYGPIYTRDERALAREVDMQFRLMAARAG